MRVELGAVTQSSIDEFLEGAYFSSAFDPASMTLALADYEIVYEQVIRGTSDIAEGRKIAQYMNRITGRVIDVNASKNVSIGVIVFE